VEAGATTGAEEEEEEEDFDPNILSNFDALDEGFFLVSSVVE
jgi:hypothetical protein